MRRGRGSKVFTLLNVLISKNLHEIKGKPGFVWPTKLKVPDSKNNPDKYCDYHQDKGHNIDERYHLKKMIEKMINIGELTQFIKDPRDKFGPREDRE